MEQIKEFQTLLEEFKRMPKSKPEPTYLDICHYSGRRFEEICSRILCFYFQPKNEHGLGTLLLESMFEAIGCDNVNIGGDIEINLEVNADGKRLDMLISGEEWVIGIENKVWGNTDNPWGEYKKCIEDCGKKHNFYVLLSLREISKEEEKNTGFTVVSYTKFFDILKNKIGQYISNNNMKHVVFLYDFIQTLKNKESDGVIMNEKLDAFFRENSECLDELVKSYQDFNTRRVQKQLGRLYEIREKIVNITNGAEWKTWRQLAGSMSRCSLYFGQNNVGVESWFAEENNDLQAHFHISLTTWNARAWTQYGKKLKKVYPEAEYKTENEMSRLLVYKIAGQNEKDIIDKLFECYKHIESILKE
jgi:hypothetical protein